MNTLLYKSEELLADQTLRVSGRRAKHLNKVLGVEVGRLVRVGELNGALRQARVMALKEEEIVLSLEGKINQSPLLESDSMILALPRPQMLKRIFQTVSIFGLKELHLIQAEKVDKSFFMSKQLEPSRIEENLMLGLEQSSRTRLPEVVIHNSFRDIFDASAVESKQLKLVSHPYCNNKLHSAPYSFNQDVTLAIGPEGGWTKKELQCFEEHGFEMVSISENILKVEQAVTVFLSQLECKRD